METGTSSVRDASGRSGAPVQSPRLLLLLSLSLGLCATVGAAPETLCGAELVDALQFVCGPRGFHFLKQNGQKSGGGGGGGGGGGRRVQRGIVEECCFRRCTLRLLESYCADSSKLERDYSGIKIASLKRLIRKSKGSVPGKEESGTRQSKKSWQRRQEQGQGQGQGQGRGRGRGRGRTERRLRKAARLRPFDPTSPTPP
ncbi:insulin-like growth factor 1 isoform X2 [Petromyzon marinus]|uniref:Insulin-like growth factor I isoform X2 n=1 Tax=Petromyzon marinus TaxID=7757 RepID=A0AAJ7SVJ1_PETMA|nr:insulin-like growth factor I isoform X2 [Petromyzon marinus]